MQLAVGRFGSPKLQPGGNGLKREGRLAPQARGNGQFGRILFPASQQLALGPTMAPEFFGDDSLRLGVGRLAMQFPSVASSQTALRSPQHVSHKSVAPEKPSAPQRLVSFRVGFLTA